MLPTLIEDAAMCYYLAGDIHLPSISTLTYEG